MQPIIYSKLLFYILVNCHIPSKFGSASNILPFALSVLGNISESSFNLKVFTGITSSRIYASFLSQPLYVSKFASTEFLWLHKHSLIWWQCQHAQGQLFDLQFHLCSIWLPLIALSLSFSLLHLHPYWPLLSLDYTFFKKVMWINN